MVTLSAAIDATADEAASASRPAGKAVALAALIRSAPRANWESGDKDSAVDPTSTVHGVSLVTAREEVKKCEDAPVLPLCSRRRLFHRPGLWRYPRQHRLHGYRLSKSRYLHASLISTSPNQEHQVWRASCTSRCSYHRIALAIAESGLWVGTKRC